MNKKIFLIIALFFMATSLGADEILEKFDDESISIYNETIRKIKKGDNVELNILRDNDDDTKIQTEESADEDIIRFDIAGTEQITIQDGKITATTDNDIDLFSSTVEGKNLYLDGTTYTDALQLSTGVTATEIEDNDSLGTSDVKLCTQGNVKAYVDGQISGISGVRLPSGAVFFMITGSCPTGTTDVTATYSTRYLKVHATQGTEAGPTLTGATDSHTLTEAQMPSHFHGETVPSGTSGGSISHGEYDAGHDNTGSQAADLNTTATGGGTGHPHNLSAATTLEPKSVTAKLCQVD